MDERIAPVRGALLMLFWGVVVVYADVRVNGFDLLNDVAGWLLVAVALTRVRGAHADERFHDRATAALVLAWVATVTAVIHGIDAIGYVYALLQFVQPLVTALALLRLGEVLGAEALRRTWVTTARLFAAAFVATYVVIAVSSGDSGEFLALGLAAVAFVVVAAVHYLVSIHRTRSALAEA